MKAERPVPVIMYHSVGVPDPEWAWNYLTCPWRVFESQMRWLKKTGFAAVNLSDLHRAVFEGESLPERSVILTFDDGYADNWIYACPIMKKYGMRGTVFVSPEFADPRDIARKRLDEFMPEDLKAPPDSRGYLSWKEMRKAERERTLDVQSHAMTHTWYPVSSEIVDFRHPGDRYIWMTWNANRERKPFLQLNDEGLVKLGAPVYKHKKSLSSPRYFPDPALSNALSGYVDERGGREFFKKRRWREELFEKADQLKNGSGGGRYETEEEYHERIHRELADSKRIIEENLEKRVDFLCWPGGSGTERGAAMAREIGYKMTTAAGDLSREYRDRLLNLPSQKSNRIARTSSVLYWDGRVERDSRIVYDSGPSLALYLLHYKRFWWARFWAPAVRAALKRIRAII